MLNLATILENSARQYPKNIAVVCNDQRLTYEMLNGAANKVAAGLVEAGISKGDRVALSCPNLPYFPMVYYGILKAGAVVVPLNVLLKPREIAYHLTDSGAKAFFCFEGTPDLPLGQMGHDAFGQVETCNKFWMITADAATPSAIDGVNTLSSLMEGRTPVFETVRTNSDDTAVILYTSGTTGHPKGAELSHTNLLTNTIAVKDIGRYTKDDITLVALPMYHSMSQTGQMNAILYVGGKLVLLPRFEPETAMALIQNENVSLFIGVPTMYWGLLRIQDAEKKFDLDRIRRSFRLCISGGAPLPIEILRQFETMFDVQILEGYGLSETSPVVSFNTLERERKPGSVGTPVWGVEVAIVDVAGRKLSGGEVGELVVKGTTVMKGYLNRPEANEQAFRNGWFHTGDMARFDEDGYIYIVDRVKDMIIRGGYNVYPREIEEVLMTHPAVSMAAVIGVPHERHGEEIKAYVVLNSDTEVSINNIIEWAKKQMAAYKYPRIVEVRESLPMNATGKILKKELRADLNSGSLA